MNEQQAWELAAWDGVETAVRLRSREVSGAEVVEAAILRAERAKVLNAINTPMFERARAQAAAPTSSDSSLAGVPTFIKDLVNVGGVRTTWGTAASGEFIPKKSDPIVKALEAVGLIGLGKSATPELGLTGTTEPLRFGPCLNPWDLTRTPGGSSGGAASLVAAGVVPLAHGSDGGGSIRVPAACCGLVGLKSTRGRRDMAGSNLLPVNVAVEGVLTRTVRDTIAFWTELERRAPNGKLEPIGPITPSKRRLRVAVFVDSPVKLPVHPDIRAATERAAKLCESLGHDVELIACPFTEEEVHAFIRLWGFVAWSQVKGGRVVMCSGFDATKIEPWAAGFCRYFTGELGAAWTGIQLMRRFSSRYAALMENLDVLISPTLAQPPPKLGHLRTDQPFEDGLRKLFDFIPFTPLINAAGAPALSLPLGRAEGVPIGVQFAAAKRNEAVLLELALALEAASPWPQLSERGPFRPE